MIRINRFFTPHPRNDIAPFADYKMDNTAWSVLYRTNIINSIKIANIQYVKPCFFMRPLIFITETDDKTFSP